jgi:hypothetical protein
MLKGHLIPTREQLGARAARYAYPDTVGMSSAGVPPATLDPDELLGLAAREAGSSDFGDGPLHEPLRVLCRSLEDEMELSAAGRFGAHRRLLQLLITRARLQALWQRHPEILEIDVAEPWFIVGLPRSGTTLLHRLLARDPALRSAPLWELMHPLPLCDPRPMAMAPPSPEPRIAMAEQALEGLHRVAPDLVRMHEMDALEPDEELNLLALGFCSMGFEFSFTVPAYVRWYALQDHTEGYRLFRRVLQTLQWLRGGRHWILKAPSHMEQLRPLLSVFPDATVIQTHRDAAVTSVSLTSLTCYGVRAYFDHPNPLVMGQSISAAVERLLHALDRDRADGDGRFFDIHFAELMRDPIGLVHRLYAARGRAYTSEAEAAMREYLGAHPRAKHGAHDYAAADFGIDLSERRRALAFYHHRFGVQE